MNKQYIKGAIFILISAIFYATYGIWSKLMIGGFGEFNQAWIRAIVLLLILLPYGVVKKSFKKIETKDYKWFVIMCLCGALNQAPYFYGFTYLSVGTATFAFYAGLTLGAYIIGKVFFAEVLTRVKWISFFLALCGMLLMYKLTITSSQILPLLFVTVAGLMGSIFVVFSKKVSDRYSETQILSMVFGGMFISNFFISMIIGEPLNPNIVTWLAQVGYIAAMLIANAAVVAGFRYLDPSIGGIIGLFEVIFGVLFGILFFGEILTLPIILGIGIMLSAIAIPDIMNITKKYRAIH